MAKIILALLDGLRLDTARKSMSYLASLAENGIARFTSLCACLPPISRPAYATLLTGLPPLEHGILHNEDSRTLDRPTIFSRAAAAGIVTGAAAYGWFYELCNGSPFELMKNRFCASPDLPLNYGLFYIHDDYPDAELLSDAGMLASHYSPGLLLAHSMGIDYAGHEFGGESSRYAAAVREADSLLAWHVPAWRDMGYDIIITSDHGMDATGSHYDIGADCRDVPLWLIGEGWREHKLPQTPAGVAHLVCARLGL